MKHTIIVILFLLTNKLLAQDSIFVATMLQFDCKENVDFEKIKNNRLVSFEKNEKEFKADFLLKLTCCGTYQLIAKYSNDTLFLKPEQTNDILCDCSCYYHATIMLPKINPKLVYWNTIEYIGIDKAEYLEQPISFELFNGDTINYYDKFQKAQGKFYLGKDYKNPNGIVQFVDGKIVSGWKSLNFHNNGTPCLIKHYKQHTVGDEAVYTTLDTSGKVISNCYRLPVFGSKYIEFCSESKNKILNKLDSNRIEYILFINDTLIYIDKKSSKVDYKKEFQKLKKMNKTTYVILLENTFYSTPFISELDAIRSKNIIICRKKIMPY